VRPASGLGLRAVRPRIPAHAWSYAAGAGIREFPPSSVISGRNLERTGEVPSCVGPPPGFDVIGTLTRFYGVGKPALHACLGLTEVRSARLSQGETPVPTKNKSAVTGRGPSLDEPDRTHRKARPASGLGLRAVRPRMPAHACSYADGAEDREFPPASLIRGQVRTGSLGASQQNIHRCDENVLRTPAF